MRISTLSIVFATLALHAHCAISPLNGLKRTDSAVSSYAYNDDSDSLSEYDVSDSGSEVGNDVEPYGSDSDTYPSKSDISYYDSNPERNSGPSLHSSSYSEPINTKVSGGSRRAAMMNKLRVSRLNWFSSSRNIPPSNPERSNGESVTNDKLPLPPKMNRFKSTLQKFSSKKNRVYIEPSTIDSITLQRAKFLSTLALSAYASAESQRNGIINDDSNCGQIKLIASHKGENNLRYVVYARNGVGYLAFEGTRSIEQWSNFNLRMELVQCQILSGLQCGHVSEGFQSAFMHLKNQIMMTLKPFTKVVITGHSLGAAIATLAAVFMADQKQVLALYTFASPRVGDLDFVKFTSKRLATTDLQRFVLETNGLLTFLPKATRQSAERRINQYFEKKSAERVAARTESFVLRLCGFINGLTEKSGRLVSAQKKQAIKDTLDVLKSVDKLVFKVPYGILQDIIDSIFFIKRDLIAALPSLPGYHSVGEAVRVLCKHDCKTFTGLHSMESYSESIKNIEVNEQCSQF